jgi:hypothetical protein
VTPEAGLAPWLLAGLALGAVFTVVVAGVFVAGERLLPGPTHRPGTGETGGVARRRREIREYLDAIDEPFEERVRVGGQVVDFHLPERDVVVTFDAHVFLAMEERGVYAVLAEHEMPGEHLGARLPFDTPDLDDDEDAADAGFSPRLGPGRAVSESFDRLGLPADATEAEVRSAYRDRVKEVHPDQGGDEEAFRRLQDAYATAREHAD